MTATIGSPETQLLSERAGRVLVVVLPLSFGGIAVEHGSSFHVLLLACDNGVHRRGSVVAELASAPNEGNLPGVMDQALVSQAWELQCW